MSKNWIIDTGTERLGPHSLEELRDMAVSGQLLPEHRLWKPGLPQPIAASEIGELFTQQKDLTISPINQRSSRVPPPLPFPKKGAEPKKSAILDTKPQDSEPEIVFQAATPPPLPFSSSRPSTTAVSKANDLLKTVKAAGEWSIKQAERTKLLKVTLPATYCSLGKNCYKSQEFRSEFADLHEKLDAIRDQLATLAKSSESEAVSKSWGDKTKATAAKAMQAAQSQKLKLKLTSLLGALGKGVYERHLEKSGPSSLTAPIAKSLTRLSELDADISRLSSERKGSWFTPKRLAIAGVFSVCLLVVAVMSNVLTGPKQNVASTSPSDRTEEVENKVAPNSRWTTSDEGEKQGKSTTTGISARAASSAPSSSSFRNFAEADYLFDFSKVNYSPVDFSTLDYSKGPNGEIIEDLFDNHPKNYRPYTQQGFMKKERVTADQAQWRGLRQEKLKTAWQTNDFVPHGYRWVWLRNSVPPKPNAESEKSLRRKDKQPPPAPKYPESKLIEQQWFNGEPHGRFAECDEDGKLLEEFFMVQGKQTGKRVGYWPDGKKQVEDWWLDGKLHGSHKRWHQNGSIKEEGAFVEDKQHGKWVFWRENGDKLQEQSWLKGVEHGMFVTYHPNGMKKAMYAMVNGKEQPGRQEWDDEGRDMKAVAEENLRNQRELQAQVAKNGFCFRILAADPSPFELNPRAFSGQLKRHPAGSLADLLQALALTNDELVVWNVSESSETKPYAPLGKYLVMFTPKLLPKTSYKEIFGSPKNMRDISEWQDLGRSVIKMDGQMWEIDCTDARVFVRAIWGGPFGDNLGQVINIHFDKHIEGVCPAPRELIKRSRPGK